MATTSTRFFSENVYKDGQEFATGQAFLSMLNRSFVCWKE